MRFEWDEEKAAGNLNKHGVSFAETETVWDNYFYIDLFDDEHSAAENRFLIIGESVEKRLLIISYTEREGGNRIISARELTPKERKEYEHGNFE